MKKKVMAMILAGTMLLTAMPQGILAAEEKFISQEETNVLFSDGEFASEPEELFGDTLAAETDTQTAAGLVTPALEEWFYEIEDGKVYLEAYSGTADKVYVPASYDGYPVVICDRLFADNEVITEVQFAPGVSAQNNLFRYIFTGCKNLETVSGIPDEIMCMTGAFEFCSSLVNVPEIPGDVTDIAGTFCWCVKLVNAPAIPDGVENMYAAFEHCESMVNTPKIPAGVVDMSYAFNGCRKITEAPMVPAGVEDISAAFSGCTNMSGEMNILANPPEYSNVFADAVINTAGLALNYTAENEGFIDSLIAAKDPESNIRKGRCLEKWEVCTHDFVTKIERAATCTEAGSQYRECTLCGYKENATAIPAKGHTYGNWVTDKNAACTVAGSKHRECSVCGNKETASIPATGIHTFGDWTTTKEATALAAGIQTRTCTACGTVEETKELPKLSPTIKLTTASLPMKVGQVVTSFKVTNLAKDDYVKSWKSGNTRIVQVKGKSNGTCKLYAQKKTGKAKITVTLASGLKKTFTVKVQKADVKTSKITGVEKKLTLKKGKSLKLKPLLTPISSRQKVTYISSNKKVAAVSSKGVIKALRPGKAKITVKSGSKKVVCTVTVKK